MNKIVLFGAGKIGRSFIGQLFSRGGYEVVFIDSNISLIEELNRKRSYRVIIKSEKGEEIMHIRNVRGLPVQRVQEIHEEISGSSILATAVGQANLPDIVPLIAGGLRLKLKRGSDCRTDLILAENLRNAGHFMRNLLIKESGDPRFIDSSIGFVETSIGKMVPIMTQSDVDEDPLQVFAEPYNTLILDKKAFLNPIPQVPGLAPKENMKAWVDRKSFIHNLGHAAAVYYGFIRHPNLVYLYEVLNDPEVMEITRQTMLQSAEALRKEYPFEFPGQDLSDHIDDLLARFQNKALGDTVFRIGMDLPRKLGPEDRLMGAIRMAERYRSPYEKISFIVACAFHFRATDEQGKRLPADNEFSKKFLTSDIREIMKSYCGIDPVKEKDIAEAIFRSNEKVRSEFLLNA